MSSLEETRVRILLKNYDEQLKVIRKQLNAHEELLDIAIEAQRLAIEAQRLGVTMPRYLRVTFTDFTT